MEAHGMTAQKAQGNMSPTPSGVDENGLPEFLPYEPVAAREGDRYRADEHYGAELIVKVLRHEEKIVTANSPNGATGLFCDVYDLDGQKLYRDVLWMSGAIVDGLIRYERKAPTVIRFMPKMSTQGRYYAAPEPADPARARAHWTKFGDPFAVIDEYEPAESDAAAQD